MHPLPAPKGEQIPCTLVRANMRSTPVPRGGGTNPSKPRDGSPSPATAPSIFPSPGRSPRLRTDLMYSPQLLCSAGCPLNSSFQHGQAVLQLLQRFLAARISAGWAQPLWRETMELQELGL